MNELNYSDKGEPVLNQNLKKRGIQFLAVLLLLSGGFYFVKNNHVKLAATNLLNAQKLGPPVETAKVKLAEREKTLTLIGEARPKVETILYAKLSGYLKELRVDRGSIVKAGDVLAIIDSPEIDQSYLAAQADAENKKKVADRYQSLIDQDLVSPQEAEQAFAVAKISQATLAAQKHLRGYEVLRAPFDGVVTDRFADPGALIQNATNSQTSALPVMTIAKTDQLKIAAYVDQKDAGLVHPGLPVQLYLPDDVAKKISGTIARTAGSLDSKTRMLLIEVDFDNSQKQIIAGSFLQVQVKVDLPKYLAVPSEALIAQSGQSMVGVVTPDRHLHFQAVDVIENDGTTLLIASGVKEGDEIALNVGENLKDGDPIQPQQKAVVGTSK